MIDFAEGAVLLINKPLKWTSFDVVNKIKYALKHQVGKIKVGHAGTLDPLATGLLIVCTGKMTKQIEQIQNAPKEYTGQFFIGATRPSYDKETEIDSSYPTEHISAEKIQEITTSFLGKQAQFPPIFSAIKQGGKPIYLNARKGKEVIVEARNIEITLFETTPNLPLVDFKIQCSKGTYIRSIAFDFGKKLDSGGYLESLCRTKIGDYSLADAKSIETWIEEIKSHPKL